MSGPTEEGLELEIVGEIAGMIALGLSGSEKTALDEKAVCSVKVVAGIGFEPMTFRL